MRLDQHEIVMCAGRGGCGKTTMLARLTSAWPAWATWLHAPSLADVERHWPHLRGHLCWPDRPPPDRDCYLILDELDLLYPASGSVAPWVVEVFARGRHRGVRVAAATQGISTVHPTARRNCRVVYLGRTTGHDLQTAIRQWGPEAAAAADLRADPATGTFEFLRLDL